MEESNPSMNEAGRVSRGTQAAVARAGTPRRSAGNQLTFEKQAYIIFFEYFTSLAKPFHRMSAVSHVRSC
jgi:hypothetical protein